MKKSLRISILVDNPNSWFNSYLEQLFRVIKKFDPHCSFVRSSEALREGDILFMLSCNRLLTPGQLALHKNNIVVHESDLPKGRGWSPLTWQIEAGKNEIPITLFEAARQCDAGIYYLKDKIRLKGNELIDDARKKQAEKTIEMINKYLTKYPMRGVLQEGRATYYRRRKMQDSMLNIHKSITSQFNKMRVADNQRYPLYFTFKGKKYILKIYEKKE